MKCPKCSQPTEKVAFDKVEVDRCTGCRGIWFDMLEAEHLKAIEGSEAIDIGDPSVGKNLDKMAHIECPICHTPMIRMADPEQPHIHFEACKVCYGIFLDAGEFTDLKHKTLGDFFKDLLARG